MGVTAVTAAMAVGKTANIKTGPVAITYASQVTCPSTCPWYRAGCYGESGPMAWGVTNKLNSVDAGIVAAASACAAAIDRLPADRAMRLHGVGDSRTNHTTKVVSAAADRYRQRGGGPVWTYTHAWKLVDRGSWGGLSVLASVESAALADAADARGYALARVFPELPADGRTFTADDGRRYIPCPAQTGKAATCSDCRLCWDADGLRARQTGIAFEPHGSKKRMVKEALEGK